MNRRNEPQKPRTGAVGRPMGRRALLGGGVALAGGYLLAGCDQSPEGPSGTGTTPANGGGKGREAPALASRVEAGELPPVEERLPANPLVVEPTERIGVYGGTWNAGMNGTAGDYWIGYITDYDSLLRWDPASFETYPNLAESIQASPDGREFTITLREGVKWSDGEAFTADDLVFAYDDVLGNEELFPVVPTFLVSPGSNEPGTMTKVDDRTVRLTFSGPNGLFLTHLGLGEEGAYFISYPRHYLQQFHAAYNANVADVVAEEGYNSWPELFTAKAGYRENPDVPTLRAWIITTPIGEASRVVAERNPYYWKTDPEGSQLPYLDGVTWEVLTDPEVILLKSSNGEFHFQYPWITTPANRPVLAQNSEPGDYQVFELQSVRMNQMVIAFNLTHDDPVKREVFNNKDFRIGLSYAINRQELIQAVYQQQGEPWQAAPRRESEFYDEEMAQQYIDYDVDQANEYLDRAGYTQKNNDGIRLGPDGNPISFSIDVVAASTLVDTLSLVSDYWRQVGINMRVNPIERSLFYERKEANNHDGNVWAGGGGWTDAVINPRFYFPYDDEANYAIPWAAWFTSRGQNGQEPPEAPRRQMELYWQLLEEPDAEQRANLFREILQIAKEEFYVIGTVTEDGLAGVKRNDLHNAVAPMILDFQHRTPGPYKTEQFFISS